MKTIQRIREDFAYNYCKWEMEYPNGKTEDDLRIRWCLTFYQSHFKLAVLPRIKGYGKSSIIQKIEVQKHNKKHNRLRYLIPRNYRPDLVAVG